MIGLQTLEKLNTKTIALIGDVILDRYTFGVTHRVSPEAPVPVLSITKQDMKAGGAGNVALNLRSLGMNVRLMSRLGHDQSGDDVLQLLQAAGVDCSYCLREESYMTSLKTRFIASSQQLLRVDHEVSTPLAQKQERLFLDALDSYLQGVDILAVSDYAKGLLTNSLLREVIRKAKAQDIFVIVDPKGNDFTKYRGADLIKPNFSEAMSAVPSSERVLEKASLWISNSNDISHVLITKSEEGCYLYNPQCGFRHFPVIQREVRDCTGAGDTALAALAAALASKIPLDEAIRLANLSSSLVVEKVGCAAISKDELALRLLDHNPTGKILPWSSFQVVSSLFDRENALFYRMPPSKEITLSLLKKLRHQSLHKKKAQIILFQDNEPEEHTLELIAGIDAISWVVYGVDDAYLSQLSLETFH